MSFWIERCFGSSRGDQLIYNICLKLLLLLLGRNFIRSTPDNPLHISLSRIKVRSSSLEFVSTSFSNIDSSTNSFVPVGLAVLYHAKVPIRLNHWPVGQDVQCHVPPFIISCLVSCLVGYHTKLFCCYLPRDISI